VRGTGDVNHDGLSDFIWFNPSTRQITTWQTHGSDFSRFKTYDQVDVNWKAWVTTDLRAVGDFNNDGNADLLWQGTNGSLSIYLLQGTTVKTTLDVTHAQFHVPIGIFR
jgi:hypothetical protein